MGSPLEFAVPSRWTRLAQSPAEELARARVAAHYAMQTVAAIAAGELDHESDDSHTSTQWVDPVGVLAGNALYGTAWRVGLHVESLTLVVMDGERIRQRVPAAGETPSTLTSKVSRALAEATGRPNAPKVPTYKMPPHPLGQGASFEAPPADSLAELAAWYDDSDALLALFQAATVGTLPVRCWPHHFDIATVLYLDDSLPRERAPQIGVGMTPGDAHHAEPYFYVTPWPRDETAPLPPLESGGYWRPDGWFGAVLTATELGREGAAAQGEAVARFLTSAVRGGASIVRR